MKTLIKAVPFLFLGLLTGCGSYVYQPAVDELKQPRRPTEVSKPTEVQQLATQMNPCQDSLYLRLRAKPLEQLSDREYEILKLREKACNDYMAQAQRASQIQEAVAPAQNAVNAYLWIAGISTVGLLIYLFTR